MTLVIAITTPRTIWMLSDRRLTLPAGRRRDDARKCMVLETTDGKALLAYAGLGSTTMGVEPSDWMARVLRGVNRPLQPALERLAGAVQERLVPHLPSLRWLNPTGPVAHHIIGAAFHNGRPKLLSIDALSFPHQALFRATWHAAEVHEKYGQRGVRIMFSGSGGRVLQDHINTWSRPLKKALEAHMRKRISDAAMARHLAELNEFVAQRDLGVGPRCYVAWRHVDSGGGTSGFKHGAPDRTRGTYGLPMISNGVDFEAVVHSLAKETMTEHGFKTEPADLDRMNAALQEIVARPPDDHLA